MGHFTLSLGCFRSVEFLNASEDFFDVALASLQEDRVGGFVRNDHKRARRFFLRIRKFLSSHSRNRSGLGELYLNYLAQW